MESNGKVCAIKQESRAITKMIARCALYMDALKNFGSPWAPTATFQKLLRAFVVIDRMKVRVVYKI